MFKNKWSKQYNKCISCGRDDRKHGANGLCINCYLYEINKDNPEKNRIRSRKWQKENLEKAKETKEKYYKINSEKIKAYSRRWQKKNSEKAKEIKKKYYKVNSERIKEASKAWREKNREKCRESDRIKHFKYYNNNIHYKLKNNVSASIRKSLRKYLFSKEGKSTFAFLPYTVDELKRHLEKQFEPWMNWGNWGVGRSKWNIDHIKPNSLFDYKSMNDKEFQKCWALSNLRPLDAIENMKKGSKVLS